MFNPIKKIFTYIQKNAREGTMFGNTTTTTSEIAIANDEGVESSSSMREREEQQQREVKAAANILAAIDDDDEEEDDEEEEEEFDIERQIKTSIIDATKVTKVAALLSPNDLDDELADFAHEPTLALSRDEDLEEQLLELDHYPNNEIIVLHDTDLNSSLASDNVSEDPLAIDDFTQPLARDSDHVLDSSSVTTNEEADTSADLIWLKLTPDAELEQTNRAAAATTTTTVGLNATKPKTREDELRNDGGSDSGLGSETSTLQTSLHSSQLATPTAPTTTSTAIGQSCLMSSSVDLPTSSSRSQVTPLRSNLKRRLEETDGMDLGLVSASSHLASAGAQQKRPKRSINFDNVKIYYFPRQQGFSCVPTAGGCTLGMGARHIAFKTMTLAEHAAELRRAHRSQNQELQQRGSSSDDSEESEEDYLSEGSGSDADGDLNGFLQPVTPKQRRALLKAAGVRKIDASEKLDCRDIRNSREVCGCSCREFCDPETCACSQAGIKCQVDRAMFPCGCTREACGNNVGRVEFNPTRVRTHYIHTVMRLDLEQRQGQNTAAAATSAISGLGYGQSAVPAAAAAASHCYFMQTQSNYSSGYASPAYTPESSVNYYQQQQSKPTTATTPYALDSIDASLFASGSNATPSYGELLATPPYHGLSYGSVNSSQLSPFSGYLPTVVATSPITAASAYSSCAVPSAPPFGNATTTASAAQYHQAHVLETTVASMTSTSTFSSVSSSARLASSAAAAAAGAEFVSLNTPIGSSSRLSQINDLLQHNRNTTAALVAVSESPGSGLGYASVNSIAASSAIDSIETPPIEDAQRSCLAFESLPAPLVNPTPIVAVIEHKQSQSHNKPKAMPSAPQPRQPLDVMAPESA